MTDEDKRQIRTKAAELALDTMKGHNLPNAKFSQYTFNLADDIANFIIDGSKPVAPTKAEV